MAGKAAELAVRLSEEGASSTAAGLDKVASSASGMGDKVEAAGRSAEKGAAGIDKTAESADEMASKGSQAAGAMAGLGDLIGGPFGAAMQTGGIGLQAMADSGDLLNAALENSVVTSLRAKAATVAKTVADKAQTVATVAATIAQKALNVAMRANPVGLIITGVLLLVGLFVLLYKRSDKFRAIVDKAMAVAKAGVEKVIDIFRALGPIVGKVASFIGKVVTTYVNVYVTAFKVSLAVVKAVWGAIRDAVGKVVDAIKGKAGDLKDKLSAVFRTIKEVGIRYFNLLTAPIQTIIDLVDKLLDKIGSIHLPSIPGVSKLGSLFGGGGGDNTLMATQPATGATVNQFDIKLTGTASPADADAFMATVDQRLRSLGRAPVFSR